MINIIIIINDDNDYGNDDINNINNVYDINV